MYQATFHKRLPGNLPPVASTALGGTANDTNARSHPAA
jgi:hypothetical protein